MCISNVLVEILIYKDVQKSKIENNVFNLYVLFKY